MAIGPALSLPIVRQLSHCGPGLLHNGTRGGLRDCTNRGTRRGLGIMKGVCAGIEYPPRVLSTFGSGQNINGCHFTGDIFKYIFLNKCLYFDWNFTIKWSTRYNWQYVSIGSGKAITWINVEQDVWCHMPSPGHNELRGCIKSWINSVKHLSTFTT